MNQKSIAETYLKQDITHIILEKLSLDKKKYIELIPIANEIVCKVKGKFNLTMKSRKKITKEQIEKLCVCLHGSGIDANWYIFDSKKNWRINNSFHCMDGNGYYCGWQNFYTIIPKSVPEDFKLHFSGNQYLARKHMLRSYLEDNIVYQIDEMVKRVR